VAIMQRVGDDLFVAVLLNQDFMMHSALYQNLIAIALGKPWFPIFESQINQDDIPQLASYVGQYEMDPDCFLIMTLEDNRFYLQETGLPRFEIHPLSSDTAFVKETNTRFRFKRDLEDGALKIIAMNSSLQWEGKRIQ
jgi:hypothetical protein